MFVPLAFQTFPSLEHEIKAGRQQSPLSLASI